MTVRPARNGGRIQRFFVSGMPKSGTTFLQMLLDAHPAINCPSESHLPTLASLLRDLAGTYEQALRYFDGVTARQGIRFDREDFIAQMLAGGIDALMRADASWPTTHIGLKDNQVLDSLELYRTLLPDAKFVFVVRDPRDIGLSLWHHKVRTEAAFATSPAPKPEVVRSICKAWSLHVTRLLAARREDPDSLVVVRFEDLTGSDRDRHLALLLGFLGVHVESGTMADMWALTEFERLRRRERRRLADEVQSGFFRSGSHGQWREEFSEREIGEFGAIAEEGLSGFGYDLR